MDVHGGGCGGERQRSAGRRNGGVVEVRYEGVAIIEVRGRCLMSWREASWCREVTTMYYGVMEQWLWRLHGESMVVLWAHGRCIDTRW